MASKEAISGMCIFQVSYSSTETGERTAATTASRNKRENVVKQDRNTSTGGAQYLRFPMVSMGAYELVQLKKADPFNQ